MRKISNVINRLSRRYQLLLTRVAPRSPTDNNNDGESLYQTRITTIVRSFTLQFGDRGETIRSESHILRILRSTITPRVGYLQHSDKPSNTACEADSIVHYSHRVIDLTVSPMTLKAQPTSIRAKSSITSMFLMFHGPYSWTFRKSKFLDRVLESRTCPLTARVLSRTKRILRRMLQASARSHGCLARQGGTYKGQ